MLIHSKASIIRSPARPRSIASWSLLFAMLLILPHKLRAASGTEFFESRIRPVLVESCLECHSAAKAKGGLVLESRAGWIKGGDSGPAIVPGNPGESLLLRAIRHTDSNLKMPAKAAKLPDRVVNDFAQWIAMGAPDPRGAPGVEAAAGSENSGPKLRARRFALTDEDRAWWSFQPVRRPTIPGKPDTGLGPVDRFLLERLAAKGLGFNPPASRRELLRRAAFDLTGLPPDAAAVEAFERDQRPDAWERRVDELLASPQYGERWARHWLDLVRFAESNGYERDGAKPHAWRYRDYVVQSFNRDKPYDQFVMEQIAGDEMGSGFDPERIVATGFYRLHVWDDEPDSTLSAEFDDLDDILVTTGATFLGLTLGCARCHDHKYDPISQPDYYRTLALIRSINPYGQHKTGGGGRGTGKITRPLVPPATARQREEERQQRLKPLRAELAAAPDEAAKKRIQQQIQRVESEPLYELALAVQEDPVKPTHVLRRGVAQSPGEEVQPGLPGIFGDQLLSIEAPAEDRSSSGRRLALARWMTSPGNPLTARVMMNRLWQHHFGRGLVATPNDFGRTGLMPTHPELLDFLAAEFMAGGWKLKRMHKLILMSQAYQMSSRTLQPKGLELDEANQLWWRQNPRRIEAEVLRDTLLAVSGSLNLKMGGPGMYPALPKAVHGTQDSEGKGWQESPMSEQNRRSIYIFVKRALIPPLLEVFDYTTTTVPVGERAVTTVAPQALMLLNDSFVQQQSERLAARLERESGPADGARVERAFALVLQRKPTEAERQAAVAMLGRQRGFALESGVGAGAAAGRLALQRFCTAMLNLNELLYVD